MKTTKVRELGAAELQEQARKTTEQLFRIRFQMKLGQTEGIKTLRSLKKDVARFKTVERERALSIRGAGPGTAGTAAIKGRPTGAGKVSK